MRLSAIIALSITVHFRCARTILPGRNPCSLGRDRISAWCSCLRIWRQEIKANNFGTTQTAVLPQSLHVKRATSFAEGHLYVSILITRVQLTTYMSITRLPSCHSKLIAWGLNPRTTSFPLLIAKFCSVKVITVKTIIIIWLILLWAQMGLLVLLWMSAR